MQRINNHFINEKYSIDKERKELKTSISRGTIDLQEVLPNLHTTFDKKTFLESIEKKLEEFDDDVIFEVEPYGHDGGFDINILVPMTIVETNREVVERLKRVEIVKRKEENKILEAKKLLNIK